MRLTTACFLFFFLAGALSLPRESDSAYLVQQLNSLDPLSERNAENNAVQVRSKRSNDSVLPSIVSSGVVSSLSDISLPSPAVDFLKSLGVTNVNTLQDLVSSISDGNLFREILATFTRLPVAEIENILQNGGIENIPVVGPMIKLMRTALSIPRDIMGNISNMIISFLRSVRDLFTGLVP